MSRSFEAEMNILAGTHAWSATPDNYSSLRYVKFGQHRAGTIIYGYGQTIYAKIDCRYEIPVSGRVRFEYLPTPQLQGRPPFEPDEANRWKEVDFLLTEAGSVVREDVTGFAFGFSWMLEFSERLYPDGLSFPYPVPKQFFGYREKIGDRSTPVS